MRFSSLEQTTTEYRIDFILYYLFCVTAVAVLLIEEPVDTYFFLLFCITAGAAGWTLLEYLLHRFILHGVAPFKDWHALHHDRPSALIATPLVLSLSLFFLLFTVPSWIYFGCWPALALTAGMMSGYLVYGLIHHAIHHNNTPWFTSAAWLSKRRVCHALHHATYNILRADESVSPCHFGVSIGLWDWVFHTNILRLQVNPKK